MDAVCPASQQVSKSMPFSCTMLMRFIVAKYCGPRVVYLTDINEESLSNARSNAALNGFSSDVVSEPMAALQVAGASEPSVTGDAPRSQTVVHVDKVNWSDKTTFPAETVDIILGSDLVYDARILSILVPTIATTLALGGTLLYTCPCTDRDGMADFVAVCFFFLCYICRVFACNKN